MRRRLGALLALTAMIAGVSPAHAATPRRVARLAKAGQAAFWPARMATPTLYRAANPDDPDERAYATLNGSGHRDYAWRYHMDVTAPAERLRIAMDTPGAFDGAWIEAFSPRGPAGYASGWNSAEIVVRNPAKGTWTIVAHTADNVPDFRLRAALQNTPPKPRTRRALLPNLRLVPPYEFTFANPYRGTYRWYGARGVPAPDGAANCWWDEVVEHQAVRCLRFSVGPMNSGEGPFELVFDDAGAIGATPVRQIITYSDGSKSERPAGSAEFHKTHMHYHHSGFGTLELLKVTDPKRGIMEPAGTGPKQGFCTADVIAYEWTRFLGRQNEVYSECRNGRGPAGTYSPTGTAMGISPGWADIYDWSQSGNYVEFGLNGDGRYVVRSTTDASGWVLESNEHDNTSYAYIEVTGTAIRVLERGFGNGPWDRRKQLARDILRPAPKGFES